MGDRQGQAEQTCLQSLRLWEDPASNTKRQEESLLPLLAGQPTYPTVPWLTLNKLCKIHSRAGM